MTLSFFEELDFDDTAETQEQAPAKRLRRRRLGGGGRGGGERPPRRGREGPGPHVQLQRLIPVLLAIVAIIVVAVFWIRSCQADAQKRAYRHYVSDVNSVVTQSQAIGVRLDDAFASGDQTTNGLLRTVKTLEQQHRDVEQQAAALHDTGKLKGLQVWLTTSMQYRTQGLHALEIALAKAFVPKKVTKSGAAAVATAYERLLASDVLYSDSFRAPAEAALTEAGVTNAPIKTSTFALTPSYVDEQSMQDALNAIAGSGTTTSGGKVVCPTGVPIGSALESVVAQPSGTQLVPGKVTKVVGSNQLTYVVTVKNSGEQRLNQIQVRFRELNRTPAVLPQKKPIKFLEPGQTGTVVFQPAEPLFVQPEKIVVEVRPAPCETLKTNNSATYQVQYEIH